MADYDKLVEEFFYKKENILSAKDIQNLLKEAVLLEKVFGWDSFINYLDKFVQRIQDGLPFKLKDGLEVTFATSTADTLNKVKSSPEWQKLDASQKQQKVKELFPAGFPTTDGKNVRLTVISKDPFTISKAPSQASKDSQDITKLSGTGTADFKEGLVCYFYNLIQTNKILFDAAAQKLVANQNTKLSLPVDLVSDQTLYGPATDLVPPAINLLNNGMPNKDQKKLFMNAISCAYAVDELVKKQQIPPKNLVIDRGELFKNIRQYAVEITKTDADKWNPSDVYLYNKANVAKINAILKSAKETESVISKYLEEKLRDVGINELFSENKKIILGVSLKQEDSQHGKGLGITKFASALFPRENIKHYEMEDDSRQLIKNIDSNSFESINDKTLDQWRKKLNSQKQKSLSLLKQYSKKIVVDDDILEEKAEKLPKNISILDTIIKKYECYRFMEAYLNEFPKIKKFSKAMDKQVDPLLALTSYAVSLTGFNPTFYKVQGSASNATGAHTTKFSGQEFLKLATNNSTLEDRADYSGFKFKFVASMGINDNGTPKLWETSLNFRFKGDAQMSVEVYEFTEK